MHKKRGKREQPKNIFSDYSGMKGPFFTYVLEDHTQIREEEILAAMPDVIAALKKRCREEILTYRGVRFILDFMVDYVDDFFVPDETKKSDDNRN